MSDFTRQPDRPPAQATWEKDVRSIEVISYVLSFVYIVIYWNNHHHLIWVNLHLLFWLSLLPFSTGWMGENFRAVTNLLIRPVA